SAIYDVCNQVRRIGNGGLGMGNGERNNCPLTLSAPSSPSSPPSLPLLSQLWDTCRTTVRPRLNDLAQRIVPKATWHDLVLPEAQCQILHDIAAQLRQRVKVYETWEFALRSANGLGISALFAGASGTGKTMAAEVLAQEFCLDLYRIDLSQVVSKYIGETEKNLRRVFDAAETGGAILLFDEADALFGKRSEVKDSHDRYANIEVSYLLQRMEAYRGLAILTTNLKNAIDTAFLRRIRFVVQFPFPDFTQRQEIWRRIFPAKMPIEGVDVNKLAKLNVTGGNIRNIALNAAFLAADAGEAVQMKHLLRAAQSEYAKLEKQLTEAEVGGWV
ncbi:ATP-binding protein, partial [Brasilonema sp. UFV-L1]|uniref:ATP-binding protein n=1 Tax=Brasilonema sp. UFV-L1 TaxID=2234130 RepID=UPI00145E82A3